MTDSLQPLQPLPPLPPVIIPEIPVITPTVEYPEEEIGREPWWFDIAKWVGEWIVDTILRPTTEWFIDLINWITDELRYWKHEFFNLMAEVYATDLGFLYIFAATILITVYTPQILSKIAASGFGVAIKKVASWVKEKIGNILNLIAIEDILAINSMAKLLWPEWRELMGMLSDVTSALAEELGQGSAYISAWFSTVHAFALLGTSFLDIEPEAAELQAFEDTDAFLKKINENFRKYAHDPGSIVRDIIDELYIPYATQFKDSQQALIDSLAQANNDIGDTFSLIKAAQDALDHFIGIQPEETAAIVEKKLGPISTALHDFIDDYNLYVRPVLEGSIAALEVRADIIEERNAILAEKVDDPLYTLGMYELMSSEKQELYNRAILLMAREAEDDEVNKIMLPALAEIEREVVSAIIPVTAGLIMPSLGYEPAGAGPAAVEPGERKDDWFVGEF